MPDQPDQPAAPPSNKKWIALACCGCLALASVPLGLFVVGAAGGGFALYKVAQEIAPAKVVVANFLAQTSAGDATGAYAHFSEPLKKEKSLEAFTASVEKHPELFKVGEPDLPGFNLKNGVLLLRGTVKNEKGEALNCSFELVKEGETWRLLAYTITPEAIAEPK